MRTGVIGRGEIWHCSCLRDRYLAMNSLIAAIVASARIVTPRRIAPVSKMVGISSPILLNIRLYSYEIRIADLALRH